METVRTLVKWRLNIHPDHNDAFTDDQLNKTGYIVGFTKSPDQPSTITRSGGPGSTKVIVACDQDNKLHELYLHELTVIK